MKRLALALLLIATSLVADDVVDAAKAAKANRRKSTTKVITNEDVKKSKGTLIERPLPPIEVQREPGLLEQQRAKKKAETARHEQRAAAEERVADLEAELAAIEQQYYDENDLNKRDTEIVKRFLEVKAKLDQARADLAALPNP